MAGPVYVLCALTSCACAFFLLRGYQQRGVRLLDGVIYGLVWDTK